MGKRPRRRVVFAALAILLLLALRPAWTPAIPGGIASLEQIEIHGSKQWILVRGEDLNAPVLLVLHGGAGLPLMPLAYKFQRPLEKSFIVVNWDQRGSGKSFQPKAVGIEQLVQDAIALSETLNNRFHRKIYILGHSWGSYLGIVAAQRRPDLYAGFIGVGQIVRWDPTHQKRGESMHGKSSKKLLLPYLLAPEYTSADYLRALAGFGFSAPARLELQGRDIRGVKLAIPATIMQGRFDGITPLEAAEAYAHESGANLVVFEHSAHWPFAEENERFVQEMTKIAQGSLNSQSSRARPSSF